MMTISRVAAASGISAKMIRYYEATGLLPTASRTASGYRLYSETDLHLLRFIRRARGLGFTLEQTGELLALWQDRNRASADVKALAESHIAALEAKITELASMRDTLRNLLAGCHGDQRPDCPILDDLAASTADQVPQKVLRMSPPGGGG
jgi:MerR family transcriptional regulator, copper efflux regulator